MGPFFMYAFSLFSILSVQNCIVAATISCPLDSAGGYLWSSAAANTVVKGHCNYADPHFVKNIQSELSRTCSSKGIWSAVDFTGCSVMPGTGPILLIWHLLRTGSVYTVDQRQAILEANEAQLLSGISVPFLSVARILSRTVNGNVSVTFEVMLNKTALEQVGGAASLDRALSALNVTTLYHYTVLPTGGGHQIIIPSDSCQCRPSTNSSVVQVCTNSFIPPCVCTSTSCQCKNNYIGDGHKCTPDTDGDGYPDVPLDTCSNTSNHTYCIKDVCPQTYNPAQNPLDCQVLPGYIGCPYGKDHAWPIYWANTPYNTTNKQKCPSGAVFASRVCSTTGWQQSIVSHCQSHAFNYVQNQAVASLFNTTNKSVADSLQHAQNITTSLLILSTIPTDPSASSLLPQDLNLTSYVIKSSVDILHSSLNSSKILTSQLDLIDLFNNILHETNINGWLSLQQIGSGSQLLLDSAERYALYLLNSNQSQVFERSSIVFEAMTVNHSRGNDYTFPQSIIDIENYTANQFIPAQITLPPSLLANVVQGSNLSMVTSILFNNMESILPINSSNTTIASKVISVQVPGNSSDLVRTRAKLKFTLNYTNYNTSTSTATYQCVYWQSDTENFTNGFWSPEGLLTTNITVLEDGTTVIDCESTHLTCFAVLVDVSGILFSPEETPTQSFNSGDNSSSAESNDTMTQNTTLISQDELEAMNIVSYIGCAISIISLAIAVVFFLSLGKTLLTSVNNFIHLNLSISLLVALFLFSVGVQTATSNFGGCIFVATLLHYFLLASFSWMLCEGIMLFLLLVVVFSTMAKKWWGFLIVGWGLPLPVVIVSVAVRHSQYGIRDSNGNLIACWLPTTSGIIWAFVGPMLLAIAANIVFISSALIVIARAKSRNNKYSKKLFWTLMSATASLLPLLGLTWVFGLLAVNQNTTVFAWLFTIFNSLQGLFILIFHVLRNDKFKKTCLFKTIARKSGLKRPTLTSTRSSISHHHRLSRTSQSSVSSRISNVTQISTTSIANLASLPKAVVISNKRSELSEDSKQCQLMTIKEELNDEDFKMAEGFIDKNS